MNKTLTNREYQVCSLLVQGKNNFEIAQELELSKNTVKEYLKDIFKKFNAENRTRLAYILGKENIIEL